MKFKDRVKELRRVKASELIPNPHNWRTHSREQLSTLRGLFEEVGFAGAELAIETPDGLMLIDGHARAKIAGKQEVPVLILDLDEAEAKKVLATFDPVAGMAGIDAEKLEALLKEVSSECDAITKLLEDVSAEAGLTTTPEIIEDEIPEPPKKAITKRGDIWLLGDHRLMCGDSTKAEDVGRLLDGRVPFLMVTDPPYGVDHNPVWREEAGVSTFGPQAKGLVNNDDRIDWTPAYQLFPGLVAYVWHADRHAAEIVANLRGARFEIRTQIIWRKPQIVFGRGHYHWQHEPCWYAVRKGTAKWCGDRDQSTVWEIKSMHLMGGARGDHDNPVTGHSTQKPVECMARPIRNHGGKDDDVYDPFSGSGTTIIAAEQLGRRCYAMEIDPRYVDVGVMRWEKLTGKKAKLCKKGKLGRKR